MSGVAGSSGPRRIEGWSGVPITSRVPALALVALIGIAAVVRATAPFVFVGILFIYLYTRRFGTRSPALAAVLPAAAILVWRALPQPLAAAGAVDCANLLAPPAVWRFAEGFIGLATVALLVLDRRTSLSELGFRRGSRRVQLLALVALVVVTPIALDAGTIFGSPTMGGLFFGSYAIDLSQPLAFVPAVVFGASNALAEELAYRGAMRTWLVPSLGVVGANLAQAVVFGLAHTGADFVGPQGAIPVMLAMIVTGFVGGVIARRTNSLTLLIAIHLAADIPIYFYWACRVG
ncbi:MAG TPA: CPBP family intramembrane glutamic endopeptidase [Candidatus Dormibacteraeota bacterium]|nr:CPBP family intramembrane glutamic endopeptidase [Candidatus Dormibacteraeota bacterium]